MTRTEADSDFQTDAEIRQMPTTNVHDFVTWKSFVGQPWKGWTDAQDEEDEAYWQSLMNQPVDSDEIDETAIFDTFLSR